MKKRSALPHIRNSASSIGRRRRGAGNASSICSANPRRRKEASGREREGHLVPRAIPRAEKTIDLTFENPRVLRSLFGIHDQHLRILEQNLGLHVAARGNTVHLTGADQAVDRGERVLVHLYSLLKQRAEMGVEEVEAAIRMLTTGPQSAAALAERFHANGTTLSNGRTVLPRSLGQQAYLDAIARYDLVFGIGPAGTGKTYLAMAMAVASLLKRDFQRIILTRPAVEAGEILGFLPGDLAEKVDPYLRPLYDALHDMVDPEQARRWLAEGTIEVAPLAFMRGRTLSTSFVILDEAQNCTPPQMKMFLTRLGPDSKAVVTGDITQIDLPDPRQSGLVGAVRLLADIPEIKVHYLTETDVVRHRLVQTIIAAYNGGEPHGR
ncbi:MAG: PhoH family protein [Deltaproteobacteria bacterium]|nr:PhoH family protein [Deltaproteobacteria bacterium]